MRKGRAHPLAFWGPLAAGGVALGLLYLLFGFYQRWRIQPERGNDGVHYGTPVEGMRAGIELVEVEAGVRQGWYVRCRLVLKNVGSEPVRVQSFSSQMLRKSEPPFDIRVDGRRHKPATNVWRTGLGRVVASEFALIPPGNTAEQTWLPIPLHIWSVGTERPVSIAYSYSSVDAPETYLTATGDGQYKQVPVPQLWRGEIRSGDLELRPRLAGWPHTVVGTLLFVAMCLLPILVFHRAHRFFCDPGLRGRSRPPGGEQDR